MDKAKVLLLVRFIVSMHVEKRLVLLFTRAKCALSSDSLDAVVTLVFMPGRLRLAGRGHAVHGGVLPEESHDVEQEQHAQTNEDIDEHGEAGLEMNQGGNVSRNKQHTDEEKHTIYAMLLHRTSFGVLKHGVTMAVAAETGVPLRTVQRIWKNGKDGGYLE
ncbi:hypothetical protein GUJ93_ZPchr0005g15696 [Zizania palustris]|uniref:DUF7769 domain-containing protein n=1 Tax=Zizania palustris TaxID=103762 RepID=A0A8J5S5A2_ZIZPA|nr:hypothetical protein GUJ93_ZPchr0005g15696 [Zizania palustris]